VKKNTFTILCLLAVGVAGGIACQKAENANTNKPTNSPALSNAAKESPVMTPVSSDTAPSKAMGSPTDAYKAAYEARKNKDVGALRKLMSKDIMEFFGLVAEDEKKTVDDVLRELCERPKAATAEVRSEKITGDLATLEYLDENGKWSTMDFEKEDGGWKLTAPKADTNSKDEKKVKKSGEKDNK